MTTTIRLKSQLHLSLNNTASSLKLKHNSPGLMPLSLPSSVFKPTSSATVLPYSRLPVTGCLVPTEAELARAEGRAYESADQLLQRILQERRAKWESEQLATMKADG